MSKFNRHLTLLLITWISGSTVGILAVLVGLPWFTNVLLGTFSFAVPIFILVLILEE